MKMTSKILLGLSVILCGSAYADESESINEPLAQHVAQTDVRMGYPYLSLGLGPFPIPLPVFGGGHRFQRGHHGLDTSISAATMFAVTGLKGSMVYDYYFKPNPASQFYAGVGPAILAGFAKGECKTKGAAEVVFGKQYTTSTGDIRYFQVDIDVPFTERVIPLVVIKYGIGF